MISLDTALDVARSALEHHRLPIVPPTLVRAGSATVLKAGGTVVRITDGVPVDELVVQTRFASWLAEHGIPTAVPLGERPYRRGGLAATVWRRERIVADEASPERVGLMLRELHSLRAPAWLPPFDMLAVTRRRLHRLELEGLDEGERRLLVSATRVAESIVRTMEGDRAVHGDVSGNVLMTDRGPVLIDFENVGQGDPAWDLARVIHGGSRFSRPPASVRRLVEAYGGDPATLARAERAVPVIDLVGTVWTVAGRGGLDSRMRDESVVRLRWLAGDDATPWTAL